MAKKLEDNSSYNQYDADGDGVVSDRKEDQLRQMAWVAMLSMVLFTIALFLPFLSVERLTALDNLLSMFYIAQAGVVATFFGSSAYMSKN